MVQQTDLSTTTTTEGIRLDIGAGAFCQSGFTPIDIKHGHDALKLDYPDDSVDEIHASHVLEHFSHRDSIKALREWVRVLKPGGTIRIAVPDFLYCAKGYIEGRREPFAAYVFGGQYDEHDFHKTCFDEEHLRGVMSAVGLSDIKPWEAEKIDGYCAALPVSLNLQGTKGGCATELSKPFPMHRKITAVMSMPRLAFADNMFCALQSLTPLQIPFEKVTGAFWGPCMTRIMEPHLQDGTDWILTLDYDTVFNIHHLKALAVLMEEHPEADAIAPIQFKRDEDQVLFRPVDEATDQYRTGAMSLGDVEGPLTRVGWAHFGLTLIRTSALRKLKKPWFIGQPGPDGGWGDGRVDDDIYFWENFRASGCKLYLANHVTIGHLQLMVTWAGQDFSPVHQYPSQYHRDGPPQEARR
jgi:predicted SAM-dependent methyltransferase